MTSPTQSRTWAVPGSDANADRGICSLTYKGSTLRFRTNPNLIRWTYNLNTHVDTTYGGRVVQLLSTNIGDLRVVAEAGGGRWDYLQQVAKWFRDLLIDQRGGEPAEFAYTTRGWRLKVYAESMPFQDRLGDTLRAFEMQFKVQEDVSGLMSRETLSQEIARLKDGIGFQKGKYNQPPGSYESETGFGDPSGPLNMVSGIVGSVASVLGGLAGQISQLQGANNPSSSTIYGNPTSAPPGTISGNPGYNPSSQSSGG